MDQYGYLVVVIFIGGILCKWFGRVGDLLIFGVGVYVDNSCGVVSIIGWGESIMKVLLVKIVIDFENYGYKVYEVVELGVKFFVEKVQGLGGVIFIDQYGYYGWVYNIFKMVFFYWNEII